MPTWDLLIATIEHRDKQLRALLKALAPQVQAAKGVGILVYRDNLEASIGAKRQRLVEASAADYVSFIDDDDMVPDYHVAKVCEALASEPDYVGWRQRYTVDGVEMQPVIHSLRNGTLWRQDARGFYRGITHFNQIRRELALLVPFSGGLGEDNRWSRAMHQTRRVTSEVFIDEVMSFHDQRSEDGFNTPRVPLTVHPRAPKYPCVTYVTGAPVGVPVDPTLAKERMFRFDVRYGVYRLAYRKGEHIPKHERAGLISDTERACVRP